MADPIRDWLDDREPGGDLWSNEDLYRVALEVGCNDPRAIHTAIALLDTANELHRVHPTIRFDHICIAIVDGLSPEHTFRWGLRRWWLMFQAWVEWRWLKLRRRVRR